MDALPLGKQAGPNRIPNGLYRSMSTFFAPLLAPILRDVVSGKGKLPAHILRATSLFFTRKSQGSTRVITDRSPCSTLTTRYTPRS